jgi:hypothetical protein
MSAALVIIGAAIFAIGAVVGVFLIVSIGIKREERDFRRTGRVGMTRLARDRISSGTRNFVDLSSRHCTDLTSAAVLTSAATRYEDALV